MASGSAPEPLLKKILPQADRVVGGVGISTDRSSARRRPQARQWALHLTGSSAGDRLGARVPAASSGGTKRPRIHQGDGAAGRCERPSVERPGTEYMTALIPLSLRKIAQYAEGFLEKGHGRVSIDSVRRRVFG